MIEESTGSQFLSDLYKGGMSVVDMAVEQLATGGISSFKSLAKGMGAFVKAVGDDVAKAFIKNYGDDAIRAIAAYGDDAGKMLALNSADDAAKLLLSSGDDLGKAALSTGDNMIDDWYGLVDDTVEGAAGSWDDVASVLDDVADDALAGQAYTGYNGITEGAGNLIDGIKITDGKVGGKIPVDEFKTIRQSSIKNPNADSITLGKYTNGLDSYIAKAGDNSSYFDMGSEWNTVRKKYNLNMRRCLNILISQL